MSFNVTLTVIILTYFLGCVSPALGQVGIVIDCFGNCEQITNEYTRDLSPGRSVNLSETIQTQENSSLWLMLFDGSLIRMASNSMIEIKDFTLNFEQKKSHLAAELHQGHALFYPRGIVISEMEPDSFRELFPLDDYAFNSIWDLYEFSEFSEKLEISLKAKEFKEYRIKKMAERIKKNEWFKVLESHYTLYTPNIVLQTMNRPIDLIYSLDHGAIFGSRNDIKGSSFPDTKGTYYLPFSQYKEGVFKSAEWYKVIDNKKVVLNNNDLGVKEYSIYLKSFSSFLMAREISMSRNQKQIEGHGAGIPIENVSKNYLTKIQKQPFNFKASVQKTNSKKSLVSLYNDFLIDLNRVEKPMLFEASLVKIFQTSDKQKREWLLKKEIKDVREKNRKILLDFGKPKPKKKKSL